MEELQFYEEGNNYHYQGFKLHEDESYFQFQDLSADYQLGEKTWFSYQHFRAISCSQRSSSQDELGCLSEVDFASLWAQVEEDDARRKSKEGDCEKALIKLEPGSGSVQKCAEMQGHRRSVLGKKALTFELVSRHFCMPIKQAAQELNVGVTVLKKRCRELGIPRWPHRKELGKLTEQEDGNLTKSKVESLQQEKKLIEERPEVMLDERTKELRQMCFKEKFKRRQQLIMGHGTW
ncbi:protein RKD3 [Setaria italica]|uniref:protein RKD3 n=1 Tax=Setaria italica TaxID=4555 RepID=UPI000646855C|nr:protein RKD3 [Setaria italica]